MIHLLVTSSNMRSKFVNNAFLSFDLMNNLLAASAIMRLKIFKFIKLHLWLILALIISHLCIKTFHLMIALVTKKLFMQSKFAIDAFFSFDLMVNLLVTRTILRSKIANNAFLSFDLMIEVSSS
jgi:hypothetical protein